MFCLEGYFSVENLNAIEAINFLIGLDLRQCYSDLGGDPQNLYFLLLNHKQVRISIKKYSPSKCSMYL